jgi:hypothetical protein
MEKIKAASGNSVSGDSFSGVFTESCFHLRVYSFYYIYFYMTCHASHITGSHAVSRVMSVFQVNFKPHNAQILDHMPFKW